MVTIYEGYEIHDCIKIVIGGFSRLHHTQAHSSLRFCITSYYKTIISEKTTHTYAVSQYKITTRKAIMYIFCESKAIVCIIQVMTEFLIVKPVCRMTEWFGLERI